MSGCPWGGVAGAEAAVVVYEAGEVGDVGGEVFGEGVEVHFFEGAEAVVED